MGKPLRGALSRPQFTQDKIPAPMASQIVMRKVDELRDFPNNPRKHPDSRINAHRAVNLHE